MSKVSTVGFPVLVCLKCMQQRSKVRKATIFGNYSALYRLRSKNRRIPMIPKIRGVNFLVFFLNIRRRLVRVLKIQMGFIITTPPLFL